MLPSRCAPALLVACSLAYAEGAFAARCPNMYIVLDKSGSMAESAKWTNAKAAIEAFTAGTVTVGSRQVPRQSTMRFGLMLYPSDNRCGAGTHQVSCDFYRSAEINAALARYSPGGATPTGEALEAAKSLPDLNDSGRPKYVILITDGAPTCKPDFPYDHATSGTRSYAVGAVQALRSDEPARDVKTFVIGFGSGVDPATLDEMAVAGGTARTDSARRYYEANDSASLTAAFDAIATVAAGELGSRTCDDSCYSNGCPDGQRCVADFVSFGSAQMNLGRCEPDPCEGIACGADQFCRDATCIPACTTRCASSQVCKDGACVADPCLDGSCACEATCRERLVCVEGECVDDPCRYVKCPASAPNCSRGNCLTFASPPTDGGFSEADGSVPGRDGGSEGDDGEAVGQAGGQGCTCASSAGAPLAAAGLVLALGLRRRRRGA